MLSVGQINIPHIKKNHSFHFKMQNLYNGIDELVL